MSSIAFTTRDHGEARIGGRERAYFGWLCREICRPWLPGGRHFDDENLYRSLMPPKRASRPPGPWGFADDFHLFWTVMDGARFGGEEVFSLQLNTAIALGSDALYLAARLHGQCEIHAYILPEDFSWFKETVADGIETGVLRKETQGYEGWDGVFELMEKDCGPIVTSYSVTGDFPPCDYENDVEGVWDSEFAKLDPSLRISPQRILFNSGKTIMNVLEEAREAMATADRIDRIEPPAFFSQGATLKRAVFGHRTAQEALSFAKAAHG